MKVLPLLLFFLPAAGHGQTALKVNLCDLVRNPEKYTRQWVEVRGAADIAFENFTLRTGDCGEHRNIWLRYGGDEPTPTTSTVNDRERGPGTVAEVDGIPVPLRRDVNLELFKSRVVAERLSSPDGSMCLHDCRLYDVTATFTGLFMAAPGLAFGGYGHLGCCHLFTILQVKDVDAVRTAVPAGGRFRCNTETWELTADQARATLKDRPCADVLDCRKAYSEQLAIVARHWDDNLDEDKGTVVRTGAHFAFWQSQDLLTTYMLNHHTKTETHGRGASPGATAKRTICKAIEAPYPRTVPIRCQTLFSNFHGPRKKPAQGEGWPRGPETVARYALEEAARRWSLALVTGLTLKKCGKPMVVNGEQFTWCEWSEPAAMQGFSIQISRSRPLHQLRGWDTAPWTLTRGSGTACVAEVQ